MTLQSLHDFWKEEIVKKRLFVINLLDADDTFCTSEFKKLKGIHDQNQASLSPDFIQKLKDAKPFAWTSKGGIFWWIGDMNVVVTGRPEEHRETTLEWFYKHFTFAESGKRRFSFISVRWNDQLESDDASYKDYYTRKSGMLYDLACKWHQVLDDSNIHHVINVIEDDANVLRMLNNRIVNMMEGLFSWIVKNGEMPVKYEE